MLKKVGIDAIYVHVPELYVDNAELAVFRGTNPGHFTEGLGITRFGVPAPNEDQVSMAATAAYRLMEANNIQPTDIFRIDTATESSLDNTRAMVSDIVGMLEQVYGTGSFSHVLGYEQKFACVSGIERVLDSCAWCAAGWDNGKYALVLATDNAQYNLNSREEPTQGAAAAAVLIGTNPKLLEIVPGALGSALRHENMDFKKPAGRTVALVDGDKSIASYLSEMNKAWLNFESAAVAIGAIKPKTAECVLDHVDRMVYHNPYMKMVMSAYALLLIQEWRLLPRWKKIENEIGRALPNDSANEVSYYWSDVYKNFRRQILNTEVFRSEFKKRIWSSTLAPEMVGDPYTASLFVGIDSMFENDKVDLTSKKVILCGYGSGSHAVIQACSVPEGYKQAANKMDLMLRLGRRRKLSMEEYESIHRGTISPRDWPEKATKRFVLKKIGATGTPEEGDREYTFAD